MKTLPHLDIEKSIERKKLVFKWDWETITDKIMIYFMSLLMLFYIYLIGWEYYKIQWIWWFGLVFIYIIYRNATEYRLTEIITQNTAEKNREIILNYGRKNDYKILKIDKKLLVLDLINNGGLTIITTSTLFFFHGEKVLMTTIRDNEGARMRQTLVFISHLFLRRKIKKLLLK